MSHEVLQHIEINVLLDSLDCGITAIGCCNTPGCQRMGNTKTFLTILILAGLLQGGVETYFRISAKQAALQNDYNPVIIGKILPWSTRSFVVKFFKIISRLAPGYQWNNSGSCCNWDSLLGESTSP